MPCADDAPCRGDVGRSETMGWSEKEKSSVGSWYCFSIRSLRCGCAWLEVRKPALPLVPGRSSFLSRFDAMNSHGQPRARLQPPLHLAHNNIDRKDLHSD